MNKHEEYFRELTQDYVDFQFNGDDEAYEAFLQSVLPEVLKVMEEYENQGNEFWLKSGKEMAMGQLSTSILLVDFETFYSEVCSLLGRDVELSEFSDSEKLLREAKSLELETENPLAKRKTFLDK